MIGIAKIAVSVGQIEESRMLILSPTASTRAEPLPIAPREPNLDGQVWGFVDTSKVNADLFIEILKREIASSYRPKDFVVVRKQAPGLALTTEQIGLLDRCRFVIFCFGD
jgi:hypothetical protein